MAHTDAAGPLEKEMRRLQIENESGNVPSAAPNDASPKVGAHEEKEEEEIASERTRAGTRADWTRREGREGEDERKREGRRGEGETGRRTWAHMSEGKEEG